MAGCDGVTREAAQGCASRVSRSAIDARLVVAGLTGRWASHSMRRRRSPVEPPAQVAPVVPLIAYRAKRCVLARDPFFVREAVNGVAPVTEASRPAPTVDTGPQQQVLLPWLRYRNDLHWHRCPRARGCGRRRIVPGGRAVRRSWRRPVRGRRTNRKASAHGHLHIASVVVIAVGVRCEGIVPAVNLEPVDAVVAVRSPSAASHCRRCSALRGRGRARTCRQGLPRRLQRHPFSRSGCAERRRERGGKLVGCVGIRAAARAEGVPILAGLAAHIHAVGASIVGAGSRPALVAAAD